LDEITEFNLTITRNLNCLQERKKHSPDGLISVPRLYLQNISERFTKQPDNLQELSKKDLQK